MKIYPSLLLSLFALSIAFSQDFSGSWNGDLKFQSMKLKVVFHLQKNEHSWTGKMDSPDQGAKNIPIEKVEVKNDSIFISDSRIAMNFKGKIVNNTILGMFKQGTFSSDLNLNKGDVKPLIRPQTPIIPFDYKTEEISVLNEKDNLTLAGTLSLPKNGKKHSLVILISGSGAQDRDETIFDHKPFAVIADYLTKNGYAVFRFDDRGTEKSTGAFFGSTTFDFANDVEAIINQLSTRKDIKSKQIGLIGHSEGGIVAAIVANKNPKVSFVISLAGSGVNGKDILIEQNYLLGKISGLNDETLEKNKEINEKIYSLILDEDWNDYDKSAESVVKKFKLYNTDLAFFDNKKIAKQIVPDNINWFKTFLEINPSEYYSKLKIPVLALNGEKDIQVSAAINLKALQATFNNKNSKSISYPNLNHLFQNATTGNISEYKEIQETFSLEVLKDILNWIKKL